VVKDSSFINKKKFWKRTDLAGVLLNHRSV